MIENIKSLQSTGVEIKLLNPVSSKIYKLDSLNLIIGDNGSGKTKLIRAIIRDLLNYKDAAEFIFTGSLENLGVVYYTAAPFYRSSPTRITQEVGFIDASPESVQKQRFMQTVQEYVEVKDLLELNVPMASIMYAKYFEIVTKLFSGSLGYNDFRTWGSSELVSAFDDYKLAVQAHSKLSRARALFNKKQDQKMKMGSKISVSTADLFSSTEVDLPESVSFDEELLVTGKAKIEARWRVMDQFISDAKPKTKGAAIKWLAALSLPEKSFNAGRRNIAVLHSLYLGNQDDKSSHEGWQQVLETTTSFVSEVIKNKCGVFSFLKGEIRFVVELSGLVRSKVPEVLVEFAHKIGLVKIGFETLSSGEAAITHQLAGISHAIHDLAASGKKNFLIFIDEGDMLLHLSWQRKYLQTIDARLSSIRDNLGLQSLQVIVATHSPLLTSDVVRSSITRMSGNGAMPSFAAPLQEIVNYSFGSPTIGAIAEKAINRLKKCKKFGPEDLQLIAQIDDEFIRDYLSRRFL